MRYTSRHFGTEYEKRVYHFLKDELGAGRLPFNADNTEVRLHKSYPTLCGTMVATDISLEAHRPGSPDSFLLTLVECKCYAGKVNTLQLNDLLTKMRLLRAHKGILAMNCRPSIGVIRQAAFFGISVLMLPLDSDPHWLL